MKIEKLNIAIQQDSDYLDALDTEYKVVTDQYMNGDIRYPIGKEQRVITRKIEKAQRQYCKLQQQAYKIREKLSSQY